MLKRARILVIDDDPLFRSLIVSLLRKQYYVSVAGDGSEGFYKALEQPPELAIIDVQMPVWDGLKTLRAFRTHPALATVKTMILSGDANRDTVLAAIYDGANDYVIKSSFSKTEFLEKIVNLLSGTATQRVAVPLTS
jgi:DNA-binding response OmpR family regulator